MWFVLAGHLKGRTVAEWKRAMSAEEFAEWKLIYYKIEPFGERRADLRAGSVASPLLNILRARWSKSPTWSKPSDWLLELGKKFGPPKVQPLQQMMAVAKAIAAAFQDQKG